MKKQKPWKYNQAISEETIERQEYARYLMINYHRRFNLPLASHCTFVFAHTLFVDLFVLHPYFCAPSIHFLCNLFIFLISFPRNAICNEQLNATINDKKMPGKENEQIEHLASRETGREQISVQLKGISY